MKISATGLWLFFTVLISELPPATGHAQTVEETYSLGCSFMEKGQYEAAIRTLQRTIFFGDDLLFGKAYNTLAECYYAMKDYSRAAHYFDLAYFVIKDDSAKTAMILRKSSSLLMQKQFNLALAELFNLPDSLGYGLEPHKQLLLGIAHYGAGNYGMSKMAFEHFIGNKPETISLLNVQFERVEKAGRINPKTARILSIIIPGAGQFYVGDIKNGINSLLLTGGLAVLSVYVAMTYSILDAFISIIPWYQRYYTGGIKKASIIARNKRDAKRANAYRQIIRIISDTKTTAGEDEQ